MSKFIDDLVESMNSATTDARAELEADRLAHHAVCDDILRAIGHRFGPTAGAQKVAEVLILVLSSVTRASVESPRARLIAAARISTMLLDQIMQETPSNGD